MVDRFGQVSGDFSLERHGARGAFGTVATSSPLFGGIQIAGGAPFDPLSLNPILAFESSGSMLAAGDAAAANLDLVATLENRVSGGANATQVTANKQPRAHVPTGVGHLYLPGVSDNYASVAFPAIGSSEDFVLEMKVDLADVDEMHLVSGSSTTERIIIYNSGTQFQCNLNGSAIGTLSNPLSTGLSVIRCERASGTVTLKQDGTTLCTLTGVNGSANFTQISKGNFSTGVDPLSGSVVNVTLSVDGTEELNIDFSDADHKASSFDCSTGQTVTINTSGNDPATIVRRPFLRFDGSASSFVGVFNESNTTGGYFFGVFSVNGDAGTSSGRVFNMKSSEDVAGYNSNRAFLWSLRNSTTNNLAYYYNHNFRGIHSGKFDPSNGVILHEVKAVDGEQFSKVNDADLQSTSLGLSTLSSEDFYIGQNPGGSGKPAIDLEALYLFDETLTDEEAAQVRDYLNSKSSIY